MRALAAILLLSLVLFASCEGDRGPIGPEGPPGSTGSGIGYTNSVNTAFGWGGSFVEAVSVTFEVTDTESMVFFLATDNVWGLGPACKCAIRLSFDGVAADNTMVMADIPTSTGGNNGASITTSAMRSFSQGSHTVTLERSGCNFDQHERLNVIVLGN